MTEIDLITYEFRTPVLLPYERELVEEVQRIKSMRTINTLARKLIPNRLEMLAKERGQAYRDLHYALDRLILKGVLKEHLVHLRHPVGRTQTKHLILVGLRVKNEHLETEE